MVEALSDKISNQMMFCLHVHGVWALRPKIAYQKFGFYKNLNCDHKRIKNVVIKYVELA